MYHGERFNAYTHLIGAMLAVAALVLMIIKADDSYRLASAITYGVCLSLLYLGSTCITVFLNLKLRLSCKKWIIA